MSETYQQKEYELRSAIDDINSIPYIFEDYVKETNSFIDRLLEETKEINTLKNQLQQKENIIKRNELIFKALHKYFSEHEEYEDNEFLRQLESCTDNDMVWLKRMAGEE